MFTLFLALILQVFNISEVAKFQKHQKRYEWDFGYEYLEIPLPKFQSHYAIIIHQTLDYLFLIENLDRIDKHADADKLTYD